MLLSTAATACGVNFKQARPMAFKNRRLYMRRKSHEADKRQLKTLLNGFVRLETAQQHAHRCYTQCYMRQNGVGQKKMRATDELHAELQRYTYM